MLKYLIPILLVASGLGLISCKAIELDLAETQEPKELGNFPTLAERTIKKERSLKKFFNKTLDQAYSSYKKFIEMKIFDPIQINIRYQKKLLKQNGMDSIFFIPIDSTKNHYFIGK